MTADVSRRCADRVDERECGMSAVLFAEAPFPST